LKGNKNEVRKMCKTIQDLFKEELDEARNATRDEAKKENLLDNIRKIMKKLNLTAQQAMDILDVPADKQKEYVALI
jgi:hypothetical protein